jgi:predicted  nucleic acid-binding Zn-ribbon protein
VSGRDIESVRQLHAVSKHGTQSVTCLECGTTYPKPANGSTTARNPGCPNCGYVGWLEVEVTVRIGRGGDASASVEAQPR